MSSIPISKEGFQALEQELDRLKKERPHVIQAIKEAREEGDLKENAGYDAARERQGMLEARIKYIESRMALFNVIDLSTLSSEKAIFGATVTVEDADTGEEREFTLLGPDEADYAKGTISIQSPVGVALLGKEVGDEITVNAPRGGSTTRSSTSSSRKRPPDSYPCQGTGVSPVRVAAPAETAWAVPRFVHANRKPAGAAGETHHMHYAPWTFCILTFGCKVNQYESQSVREAWQRMDGAETDAPAEADVILLNTCAVTANAVTDARQAVRRLQREAPGVPVVIAGCAAEVAASSLPPCPACSALWSRIINPACSTRRRSSSSPRRRREAQRRSLPPPPKPPPAPPRATVRSRPSISTDSAGPVPYSRCRTAARTGAPIALSP